MRRRRSPLGQIITTAALVFIIWYYGHWDFTLKLTFTGIIVGWAFLKMIILRRKE